MAGKLMACALAGLTSLAWGCKKTAPDVAGGAAGASPPAAAGFVVDLVQTSFTSDGLKATFLATNKGGERAVALPCLELLDATGDLVGAGSGTPLSLKAGDGDRVEVSLRAAKRSLDQAASWVVFVGKGGCVRAEARSPVVHLSRDGKALPAPRALAEATTNGRTLRLTEVKLAGSGDGATVHYKVTNSTARRVGASLCIRGLGSLECDCKTKSEALTDDFSLAPHGALSTTDAAQSVTEGTAAEIRAYQIYAAHYGCADAPEEAISNVVILEAPSAPAESGGGEADAEGADSTEEPEGD